MKTLYITSAETFSGKSALCIGLGMQFRKDGLKAAYMKPVNVRVPLREGMPYDEDVIFAKQVYDMSEPTELISPVALTPAKLEQQLRGPETDYQPKLMEAFAKMSEGRDILVMEGGRSLREGYVAGLPPKKVVELVDARVLSIIKWDDTLLYDRIMTAQNYFGEHMLGVVVNEVPKGQMEFVQDVVAPYFTRRGIRTFGVLPKESMLSAPSVKELADGLNAEVLCSSECTEELVEHMLVGAMSVESALSYFRRKPNKAVITGGDRADIQLAALETSTRCLILTGNIYPSPAVINRAEELCVPVLLTQLDTLGSIEIIEGYFGKSRFQQPVKMQRFSEMLKEHFDFDGFYKEMGIER
jgi:BioD-like phosphotransacetylase family protein